MHEDLFPYYEQELMYLRKFGEEFSQKYPQVAHALLLEKDRCLDPHVERLLEGFAFLTSRIRRKLDDEFPEFAKTLLSMVYPHYASQVPAVGIVQFAIDPQSVKLTSKQVIPKHTKLHTQPFDLQPFRGSTCQFRTCYPVELVPLAIDSVTVIKKTTGPLDSNKIQAVLNITIKSIGGLTLGEVSCQQLRLFLHGAPLSYRLYELLGNEVVRIEVSSLENQKTHVNKSFSLSSDALLPVGFDPEESIVPFPEHAFSGYKLLREYFAFPEKFLFYDIKLNECLSQFGTEKYAVIKFFLKSMPDYSSEISKENFVLGCTPIINLFPMHAEPLLTELTKSNHLIVPEAGKQNNYEVFSVEKVEAIDKDTGKAYELKPFFSFRHSVESPSSMYWYVTDEPSLDGATDTSIHFCDLAYTPSFKAHKNVKADGFEQKTISISILSTNRNLVKHIPKNRDGKTDFTAENVASFGPIKSLVLQTEPLRHPCGRDDEFWSSSDNKRHWRGSYWRLVSHLSLNYISLSKGGISALQSLLQLYDVKGIVEHENVILGLKDMKIESVTQLLKGALCRGISIKLTIDTTRFKESSYYLLTAVLNHFFSIYASINSFIQLTVVSDTEKQRVLKQWQIRMGEQPIL